MHWSSEEISIYTWRVCTQFMSWHFSVAGSLKWPCETKSLSFE
jgi:hypothetical protein